MSPRIIPAGAGVDLESVIREVEARVSGGTKVVDINAISSYFSGALIAI